MFTDAAYQSNAISHAWQLIPDLEVHARTHTHTTHASLPVKAVYHASDYQKDV